MNDNCAICLEDFTNFSNTKTLKCNHKFHVSCINKWKKSNNTCPICRETIPKKRNVLINICHNSNCINCSACFTILVIFFSILFALVLTIVYKIYNNDLEKKCLNLDYNNCISSHICKWINKTDNKYCSKI